MRIAGDFSSFSFEPRGSLAFEGADRRGISDSVVVRGGVLVLRGGRKIIFSRDQSF